MIYPNYSIKAYSLYVSTLLKRPPSLVAYKIKGILPNLFFNCDIVYVYESRVFSTLNRYSNLTVDCYPLLTIHDFIFTRHKFKSSQNY